MLLNKPSLVPNSLSTVGAAGAARQEDVHKWNDAIRKRMAGKEEDQKPQRPVKCFNWTCTRGDRFAVCFASDIVEARRFVIRHAYVHLCELDAAERESQGRAVPVSKSGRLVYYKRLESRAIQFARECELRELTREQFEELCRQQREAG